MIQDEYGLQLIARFDQWLSKSYIQFLLHHDDLFCHQNEDAGYLLNPDLKKWYLIIEFGFEKNEIICLVLKSF